jgi:hypothetical protein
LVTWQSNLLTRGPDEGLSICHMTKKCTEGLKVNFFQVQIQKIDVLKFRD